MVYLTGAGNVARRFIFIGGELFARIIFVIFIHFFGFFSYFFFFLCWFVGLLVCWFVESIEVN
jgi:hypothetical protein